MNKRENKSKYSPFYREALYCLVSDVVALIVACIVFLLCTIQGVDPQLLLIVPVIFLICIFVNYRLAILAVIEKRFNLYTTFQINIEKVSDEYMLSSRWRYKSAFHCIYPKELHVGRYRLSCRKDDGKKVRLWCVLDGKQWEMLNRICHGKQPLEIKVTYGSLSHIVVSYDGKDSLSRYLNRMI
jgi:hypothetical protein